MVWFNSNLDFFLWNSKIIGGIIGYAYAHVMEFVQLPIISPHNFNKNVPDFYTRYRLFSYIKHVFLVCIVIMMTTQVVRLIGV